MRDHKLRVLAVAFCVVVLCVVGAAAAVGQGSPLNDLFALGQGTGDSPAKAQIVQRAEPPFEPTPLAACGPGSHQQPDIDGRVPAGSAKDGFNCNLTLVGHEGTEGGFRTYRYTDKAGHECAFYDSTLLFPLNALNPGAGSVGVIVLDMSDPAHPKKTDTLTEPPMLSPHESLNLNQERGLLAAVNGNPSTYPGMFSIYDVSQDCRHPVLQASTPVARFGHESGFSQDGKTFYATSTALQAITAIDVTDPKHPTAVWQGNIFSHGMSLSDDGNRGYIADPNGNMLILDTSQIQARKENPQTREISRLTWKAASIPQNAIPFTENGHPYILEIDEYNQSTLKPTGDPDQVGAARIIDIADETKPQVIANLRLAINQPEAHKAATAAGDPGTSNAAQGYAAHYCNIPTRVDPKIVACSFIASGLRVFDISDLVHPKEVGYYVAPPQPRSENGYMASDFAMSQPTFAPERREIWFTDGTSGFYVLRVDDNVWSAANGTACTARTRSKRVRVRKRQKTTLRVKLTANKHSVRGAVVRVKGPGFSRRAKTNRRGRATFKVRAKRRGRAKVSSAYCGGRLSVRASRATRRPARFAG